MLSIELILLNHSNPYGNDISNCRASGNMLTISAQQESNKTEGDETKNYRREYNFSSFSRSFMLPDSAKVDQTKAAYTDGILTITVAKTDVPKKESVAISVD